MLASSPNTTVTTDNPSATLSCELYGYLPEQLPTIVWTFGGDQLTDDSVFTIMTQDGSHMIQNGGNTPRPSVRSVLTINRLNTTHEGTYICSSSGRVSTIYLQVVEGRLRLQHAREHDDIIPNYLPNMHIHDLYNSDRPASKFSHFIFHLIFHFFTDPHNDHAPF